MHIALIDDDAAVLDSLQSYLRRKELDVSCFTSADDFIAVRDWTARFDCVVADVRMPGMSGLDLVDRLDREQAMIPIILITGHGDVDMAVAAIKRGAFDFIEKPFNEARLLESMRNATGRSQRQKESSAKRSELRAKYEGLSERQRQVMELAADGLSNKHIATRLGISSRTVEVHRAWMMERMGASNLAELIRIQIQIKGRV